MTRTLGTCGLCSGPVTVPSIWMGVYPPTPRCAHCGATPTAPHGPRLPMQPPSPPLVLTQLRERNPHGSHRL